MLEIVFELGLQGSATCTKTLSRRDRHERLELSLESAPLSNQATQRRTGYISGVRMSQNIAMLDELEEAKICVTLFLMFDRKVEV